MRKMRPLQFLVPAVSAAALTACASWLGGDEVRVRPINTLSGLTGEPRDPLYESAAAAIEQRDYGRALDYLQEAKARNPRNIKVLNALGVIYDKLGRFDLSARYYEQARAIDPNSRIVAANLDYSRTLQGMAPSSQGPVARIGLPENFNTAPERSPTVLASGPAAGVATPGPTAVVSPAPQPAAPPVRAEGAAVAGQSFPRLEPVPISVRETIPSPALLTRAALNTEVKVAAPVAIEAPLATAQAPMIAARIASNSAPPAQPRTEVSRNAVAIPASQTTVSSARSMPTPQTRPAALPAVPALPTRVRAMTAQAAGKKLFMIGQPVRIMNASGKADRVGVVSRRLSALGWTVRLADTGRVQPVSTLVYNTRNAGAAKAMQRTLPFPVRLVADSNANGIRLLVGRDYLSWKPRNARLHALWQKGPTIASLQAPVVKGVR